MQMPHWIAVVSLGIGAPVAFSKSKKHSLWSSRTHGIAR
jgi:hypothetical protein